MLVMLGGVGLGWIECWWITWLGKGLVRVQRLWRRRGEYRYVDSGMVERSFAD